MPRDNISIFIKISLIVSLGLLPAYIFASGGFQVVDIPLVVIISLTFIGTYDKNRYLSQVNYFLPFMIWAIIINCGYVLFMYDISFLYGLAPVVYAPILLYTFIIVYSKLLDSQKLIYIYLGIILSIIITFTVKGTPIEGKRAILSFNDPNQLGYYAVILLANTILLIRYKNNINYHSTIYSILDGTIIFFAHLYLLLAVSRSAMAGVLILDICLIRNLKNLKVLIPITFFTTLAVFYVFLIKPHFIQKRLEIRAGESYSEEALSRGFKARALSPLNYLEGYQILVGRGQGGFVSTKKSSLSVLKSDKGYGGESHNIFGEIIRGYGIIGFLLFLYWLLRFIWVNRTLKDGLWIWAGLLAYNMGNYGLRWRAFWILLALMVAITRQANLLNKKQST